MKHVQLVSSGQKLGSLVEEAVRRLHTNLRVSPKEALSQAYIYIKEKKVVNLGMFVKRKAVVTLLIPPSCFARPVFVLRDGDIAYEDSDIVVIDKPAGLPTQPTQVFSDDNLYGALIAHYTKIHPHRLAYVGLHHRLDRDTSGLVLFTKKSSMNKSISEQFKDHAITKTYLAMVNGAAPEKEKWKVVAPIARIYSNKKEFRFGIDAKKGDFAETRFSVLKSIKDDVHLVQCQPITGRTHQIRIHLAHSKLPIVGDRLYGTKSEGRMMLHASQLQLTHPKTGKPLEVKSSKSLS